MTSGGRRRVLLEKRALIGSLISSYSSAERRSWGPGLRERVQAERSWSLDRATDAYVA